MCIINLIHLLLHMETVYNMYIYYIHTGIIYRCVYIVYMKIVHSFWSICYAFCSVSFALFVLFIYSTPNFINNTRVGCVNTKYHVILTVVMVIYIKYIIALLVQNNYSLGWEFNVRFEPLRRHGRRKRLILTSSCEIVMFVKYARDKDFEIKYIESL